ncbi:type II secretion system protein N [Halioglobus maricola]|uniref:Type II secretion system protein N n=1 Tax=Halioglobus maricola TaxID=2601894 RepID=A0A5P9NIJ5_9GAMM|nr:type II secretion system protein N [Halioglobus maricola]QFU75024.1 type II secretion system protein N [Halioglobus maricola]
MSRLKIGLIAVLFLVLCLVVLAPARLVLLFVPAGQAELQGVSGSLWHGAASRAIVRTDAGMFHLGELEWKLKPWSLLLLAPRVELSSSWGQQHLNALLTVHGSKDIDLAALDAQVPAELVKHFLPLQLTGLVSLQAPQIEIRDGLVTGAQGRLVWQQGGWQAGGAPRSLGDYALEFNQLEDGTLAGEVITLAGELQAEGDLGLRGREYTVDVLLSGPGLADPMLEQSLQLVATPEGGNYRVKLQGTM